MALELPRQVGSVMLDQVLEGMLDSVSTSFLIVCVVRSGILL